MKDEMRDGTKYYEESTKHKDPGSISIGRHLILHDEGLKVIRLLPKPSIVNQESKIIVYNEIIGGRLEHWYKSLVNGEMAGDIAMGGRKIELGQMSH